MSRSRLWTIIGPKGYPFAVTLNRRQALYVLASVTVIAVILSGYPALAQELGAKSSVPTASISGMFSVVSGDGTKDAAPDVTVKLAGPSPNEVPQATMTDAEGHYEFSLLSPGTYTLQAAEDGFKPWTASVTLKPGQAVTENVVLEISSVNQHVEVRAEITPIVATQSVGPTATVSDQQLAALPLPTQKFTEALSLTPGVVRTAQGKLSFDGQAESQGMLLVDSAENVDPISGSFSIPIPVDAIQSMTVYSLPESSEYGGFSGGLTAIDIKPPIPGWNYKLLDLVPSFRGKNDHLIGLLNMTPGLEFGGPLIKNKF